MAARTHRRHALRLAVTVALAFTGGVPDARAEEVGRTVADVLAEHRYRFCHEDDYPLAPDEHAWCAIVGDVSEACPSLPRACRLPPVDRTLSSLFGARGRLRRIGKRGQAAERPEQPDARRRPPDCNGSLGDLAGMSRPARVVFVAMIVLFVVALVRIVVKNLVKVRGPATSTSPDAPAAEDAEAASAPRGPVETDVERLLARARDAAARGDYARAVDDAYAALLRRLDGDGRIEIHPSRTNGDYVRALRAEPDLRRSVRSIVRDVEGVQFGATAASETVFQSILARVIPIATRVGAVLLLVLGLGTSVACGDADELQDTGYGDTSPSGAQAVIEVMGRHGVKVTRRTETLATLEGRRAVVLLPDAMLDDAIWQHVLAWVRETGGTLVIAGVPGLPREIGQLIVTDPETSPSLTPSPGVRWVGHPRVSLPPGSSVAPSASDPDAGELGDAGAIGLRVVEGPVLRRGESVVVTERRVGAGKIVVVADERLVTNAALVVDDDATFLLSLLHRSSFAPEHEVELCDGFTGAGSRTPIESVDRAHLTPFLLQLFALVALLYLWKGLPFARLRDPPSETRRAFVDHVRALGLAYRRARATRHVAGLYATWALDRLRERVHRTGRPGLIPLAGAIAARTGRAEADVMRVLVDAASLRDEAARSQRTGRVGDTTAADVALTRELGSFLAATGSRSAPSALAKSRATRSSS
jgi:hypothetical protein